MAKPRKTPPASSRRTKTRNKPDRLVRLSIAVGDPLQPAGLSEYLAVSDRSRSGRSRKARSTRRRKAEA